MIDLLSLKEDIRKCKSRIALYKQIELAFNEHFDDLTYEDNQLHYEAKAFRQGAETRLGVLEIKLEIFSGLEVPE